MLTGLITTTVRKLITSEFGIDGRLLQLFSSLTAPLAATLMTIHLIHLLESNAINNISRAQGRTEQDDEVSQHLNAISKNMRAHTDVDFPFSGCCDNAFTEAAKTLRDTNEHTMKLWPPEDDFGLIRQNMNCRSRGTRRQAAKAEWKD